MKIVLVISIVIIFAVILLAVLTTSKAYSYKHTVDSLEDNPHLSKEDNQEKKE